MVDVMLLRGDRISMADKRKDNLSSKKVLANEAFHLQCDLLMLASVNPLWNLTEKSEANCSCHGSCQSKSAFNFVSW